MPILDTQLTLELLRELLAEVEKKNADVRMHQNVVSTERGDVIELSIIATYRRNKCSSPTFCDGTEQDCYACNHSS